MLLFSAYVPFKYMIMQYRDNIIINLISQAQLLSPRTDEKIIFNSLTSKMFTTTDLSIDTRRIRTHDSILWIRVMDKFQGWQLHFIFKPIITV